MDFGDLKVYRKLVNFYSTFIDSIYNTINTQGIKSDPTTVIMRYKDYTFLLHAYINPSAMMGVTKVKSFKLFLNLGNVRYSAYVTIVERYGLTYYLVGMDSYDSEAVTIIPSFAFDKNLEKETTDDEQNTKTEDGQTVQEERRTPEESSEGNKEPDKEPGCCEAIPDLSW